MTAALRASRRAEIVRGFGAQAYTADGIDDPTIFVGVYNTADLALVEAHQGPAVIMFCGGDARHARWAVPRLNALQRLRYRTVASSSLAPILQAHGVQLDIIRDIYVGDASMFQPHPAGDAVFVGMPYERRLEYGLPLVSEVAALLPDTTFLLSRWGRAPLPFPNATAAAAWQSTAGVLKDYAASFCQIRCHLRDGFSTGICESALMGRPVCHAIDTGMPWIPQRQTADEIAAFITDARQRTPDLALAKEARAHIERIRMLRRETLASCSF